MCIWGSSMDYREQSNCCQPFCLSWDAWLAFHHLKGFFACRLHSCYQDLQLLTSQSPLEFFVHLPFSMQGLIGLSLPHGPWIMLLRTISCNLCLWALTAGSSEASGDGGNSAETTLFTIAGVTNLSLEVFKFAISTNERFRKVTTDQSEAWKQQIQTPLPVMICKY